MRKPTFHINHRPLHSKRRLFGVCVNGHKDCAAYEQGPCNAKSTNSNPVTKARQKKRKKKT